MCERFIHRKARTVSGKGTATLTVMLVLVSVLNPDSNKCLLPSVRSALAEYCTYSKSHFDGTLPPYLSASLCPYQTSRTLRSLNEKLLKIPKRNRKSVGDCSLNFIAPTIWNSLPASLRNLPTLSDFKTHLKLSFFNRNFHKSRQTMMCACACGGGRGGGG